MTIAVGLLASNGLVVAADSQLTAGQWKLEGGKVSDSGHAGGGSAGVCVITGAGFASSLSLLHTECHKAFIGNATLYGDDLASVFSSVLERFYARHVIPFAAFPTDERPDVNLLFVGQRNRRRFLFRSERAEVIDQEPYGAVGSGQFLAESLLGRYYRLPIPDIKSAVLLAAYVVSQVKESDSHCGKHTDIAVVSSHRALRLPRAFTKELDDAVLQYGYEVEPLTLRYQLALDTKEPDAAVQAFRSHLDPLLARLDQLLGPIML